MGSLAAAVARIRCPFYGDWITLFDSLARHLTREKVGLDACLPLHEAAAALKATSFAAFDQRYRVPGTAPAPAHRALLGLRASCGCATGSSR